MKTNVILPTLFILVNWLSSCQVKEEKMKQRCGSRFCSANGGNELYQLSALPIDSSEETLIFTVQLINASNNKISTKKLLSIENELNYSFKPAKIKFKLTKPIKIIDNTENIDSIFNNSNTRDTLLKKYNQKNAINIYIVPAGTALNGYTNVLTENFKIYPFTNFNYMFINQYALFNGNTIQHELGHFFGLQHTFGKNPKENSSNEAPNGFNCSISGDFICDTPADPNGKVDKDCNFVGLSNGKTYPIIPDVSNFMSYYLPHCKMNFTAMQFNLIHHFGKTYRLYLTQHK